MQKNRVENTYKAVKSRVKVAAGGCEKKDNWQESKPIEGEFHLNGTKIAAAFSARTRVGSGDRRGERVRQDTEGPAEGKS